MSFKCFISHLLNNISTEHGDIYLFEQLLSTIWIQGIVVEKSYGKSLDSHIRIDDGTGNILVSLEDCLHDQNSGPISVGDYLLIKGPIICGIDSVTGKQVTVVQASLACKLLDPNYETLWTWEVSKVLKSNKIRY